MAQKLQIKVFISSSTALREYRACVDDAFNHYNNHREAHIKYNCILFENGAYAGYINNTWGYTEGKDITDANIRMCDLVLFILGDRIGEYTQKEIRIACAMQKAMAFFRLRGHNKLNVESSVDTSDFLRNLNGKSYYTNSINVSVEEYKCLKTFKEHIENFLNERALDLIAPVYTPDEFGYELITRLNNQDFYRVSKNSNIPYLPRKVDSENDGREKPITIFKGCAMSGKTRSAVQFLKKEMEEYQEKPRFLVITPPTTTVSELKFKAAMKFLDCYGGIDNEEEGKEGRLQERKTFPLFVFVDDADYKSYGGLLNTLGRKVREFPDSLKVVLTSKNDIIWDNYSEDVVDKREIKPLNRAEWLYYKGLVSSYGIDTKCLKYNRALGALVAAEGIESVRRNFNTFNTPGIYRAKVVHAIKMLRKIRYDEEIDYIHLAKLLKYLSARDYSDVEPEIKTYERALTLCREACAALLEHKLLVEDDKETMIKVDDFIVDEIFQYSAALCPENAWNVENGVRTFKDSKEEALYLADFNNFLINEYLNEGLLPDFIKLATRKEIVLHTKFHIQNERRIKDLASLTKKMTHKLVDKEKGKFPPELVPRIMENVEEANRSKVYTWIMQFMALFVELYPNIDSAIKYRNEVYNWYIENRHSIGTGCDYLDLIDAPLLGRRYQPEGCEGRFTEELFATLRSQWIDADKHLTSVYRKSEYRFLVPLFEFLDTDTRLAILRQIIDSFDTSKVKDEADDVCDFDEEFDAEEENVHYRGSIPIKGLLTREYEHVASYEEFKSLWDMVADSVEKIGKYKEKLKEEHAGNTAVVEDMTRGYEYYTHPLVTLTINAIDKMSKNLTPEDLFSVGKFVADLTDVPEHMRLLQSALLARVMECLDLNNARNLFEHMGLLADNYACSAVIKKMGYVAAFSFVESFRKNILQKKNEGRNKELPLYRVSSVVYNILIKKATSMSEIDCISKMYEADGHVKKRDMFYVGSVIRKGFMSQTEKYGMLRESYSAGVTRDAGALSGIIYNYKREETETEEDKGNSLYDIFFGKYADDKRILAKYGISLSEQVALRSSAQFLSILFTCVPLCKLKELNPLLDSCLPYSTDLLLHKGNNILNEILKRKDFLSTYDEAKKYCDDFFAKYNSDEIPVSPNGFTYGVLFNRLSEEADGQKPCNVALYEKKANLLFSEALSVLPKNDRTYIYSNRFKVMCKREDVLQKYERESEEMKPYDFFCKYIGKMPLETITWAILVVKDQKVMNWLLDYLKKDENKSLCKEVSLSIILNLIEKGKIGEDSFGDWCQRCSVQGFFEHLCERMTQKKKKENQEYQAPLYTWEQAKEKIKIYNENNPNQQIAPTVTLLNSALKNMAERYKVLIKTKDPKTFEKDQAECNSLMNEAKRIFDNMNGEGLVTPQTLVSYSMICPDDDMVWTLLNWDGLFEKNKKAYMRIVNTLLMRSMVFDKERNAYDINKPYEVLYELAQNNRLHKLPDVVVCTLAQFFLRTCNNEAFVTMCKSMVCKKEIPVSDMFEIHQPLWDLLNTQELLTLPYTPDNKTFEKLYENVKYQEMQQGFKNSVEQFETFDSLIEFLADAIDNEQPIRFDIPLLNDVTELFFNYREKAVRREQWQRAAQWVRQNKTYPIDIMMEKVTNGKQIIECFDWYMRKDPEVKKSLKNVMLTDKTVLNDIDNAIAAIS